MSNAKMGYPAAWKTCDLRHTVPAHPLPPCGSCPSVSLQTSCCPKFEQLEVLDHTAVAQVDHDVVAADGEAAAK
jgi:hypothetical protein